jgi:hypothetical protein
MTRLDDYRRALRASFAELPDDELVSALQAGGPEFGSFIVDHGLGPLWHVRTAEKLFHESRLAAEALYAAQEHALEEIDALLGKAGIDYAVFKGAANRLILYGKPAIRACHDVDLLVRADDRVRAARALASVGYKASPEARSISRELVLSRGGVILDLHWALLREGRLRSNPVEEMIARRRRLYDLWTLSPEDALFTMLVHPAFAKHLAGWQMGLHRVADIAAWLRTQAFDWPAVRARLGANGISTAAWATLRWVALLTEPNSPQGLDKMLADLQPGRLRSAWIDRWLQGNLSERTAQTHWLRLLGFSPFLHDRPQDAVRALRGRRLAKRRQADDLAAFGQLLSQ